MQKESKRSIHDTQYIHCFCTFPQKVSSKGGLWLTILHHGGSRELYSRLTGINHHKAERMTMLQWRSGTIFVFFSKDNGVFHISFMDFLWAFGNKNDSTMLVPSVEVRSDLQAVVHHQKHTSVARSRRAPQSNSEHLWTPSGNIGNWKQPSMLSLKYNMRARRINEHDQTWWFLVLSQNTCSLERPCSTQNFFEPRCHSPYKSPRRLH